MNDQFETYTQMKQPAFETRSGSCSVRVFNTDQVVSNWNKQAASHRRCNRLSRRRNEVLLELSRPRPTSRPSSIQPRI